MRIDGYNGSPYPGQVLSSNVPSGEERPGAEELNENNATNSCEADWTGAGVVVEISSLPVSQERQELKPEQEENLLKKIGKLAKKDWDALSTLVKKWAKESKELAKKAVLYLKSLSEETEDMTDKVGNPTLSGEKRAETGVAPLTWQEAFKLRIKVLFDAVTGFLAKHLPMNSGGFFGTKEEKKEQELEGKESRNKKRESGSRGNSSDMSGSTFDQKG